jgi:hypothetical protein
VTYRLRKAEDALHWMIHQHAIGASHWHGMCQSSVRSAWGIPAWSGSAIGAWNRIPARHKHKGGKPSDAPMGAALYYAGGRYGHVALAGKHHNVCWSTDYQRNGHIGPAPRDFKRWGLRYLGWSTWSPYGSLR